MSKLSDQLMDMEGEVLHAYQDHLGYWTIGVGHLIDKRKGGRISRVVSRMLLATDIEEKSAELFKALPWVHKLDEARLGALINMAFQLGVEGLLGFTKTLIHIKSGNWQAAHDAMLQSKWHEQTPNRAERIAKQILTGEWQ